MAPSTPTTNDLYGHTTSTSSTSCDVEWHTVTYTNNYSYDYRDSYDYRERLKLVEKLVRIEKFHHMQLGWQAKKPEIKPIIKRPSEQLRGVRLDGRGWA